MQPNIQRQIGRSFSGNENGLFWIGIKNENKSKILDAFSQEDSSTTRNYGGTGLGLSITNRLLSLMGSKLVIESEILSELYDYFEPTSVKSVVVMSETEVAELRNCLLQG